MAPWQLTAGTLLPVAVPGVLYLAGRIRLRARQVRWPAGRDEAFAGGLLCVAAAIVSPLSAYDERFPVHIVQHLLLGMAAPLGFALAAPVTLLLRASPLPARRVLVRILHSGPARGLSWAPAGAVLSVGLMWPLYLTPLYTAGLSHPLLHDTVHAHMLISGCLLTFALVGADPLPGRGRSRVRVITLFGAMAAHGILAKYLYIHASSLAAAHPAIGSAASLRQGAQWLWYGGDLLDVAIATAFFATWYAAAGRQLARAQRRSISAPRTAACVSRSRRRNRYVSADGEPAPDRREYQRSRTGSGAAP
jgi:putative membrane protein